MSETTTRPFMRRSPAGSSIVRFPSTPPVPSGFTVQPSTACSGRTVPVSRSASSVTGRRTPSTRVEYASPSASNAQSAFGMTFLSMSQSALNSPLTCPERRSRRFK